MVENPRVYYNTVMVSVDQTSFIVGLIKELYTGIAHPEARTRQLLTYLPKAGGLAYPVLHERLDVRTRTDWLQSNRSERLAIVSQYFTTYPQLSQLTYFRTYTPERGQESIWHVLPGGYFPTLVQDAYYQLENDCLAFKTHKKPRLPQQPRLYSELGYFWA